MYRREEWFGPESCLAVVAGTVCLSLPYLVADLRDAIWLICAPLILGITLTAIGSLPTPWRPHARRTGVGFLAAFACLALGIPCFLAGLATASLLS